jgi:PKD repeat protein
MAAIYNPSTDTSSSTAYIVTLIVTDDVGDEYSVKKHVDLEAGIVRSLPHAEFTYSISDTTVLFDASNSYDLDGGIISTYEWHFGDGGAVTVTQPTVSHKYTTYGPFTVSLKVTNSIGVGSSTVRRVIEDVSGGISKDLCFDVRFNEDNNGYVYFDATCTPGISEDHNMVWNFGDGSGDTPYDAIVSHKYSSSGDYTVSVRTPNYNSLSKQITVNIVPYMSVYIGYNPWKHLSTECEEALTQTVILEARNPRYTGTLISEWEAIPTDEFSEYETVIFTKEGEVIELDLPEVINYSLRYRLTDDTGLYSYWDYAPPANLYIQPSVDFTYKVDPTTYTVYFDASNTTFECDGVSLGTITSYNWDFGNGISNIGETPSVVYSPLQYTVH